ncbi:MAG: sigma-70 family RNA polymerase sigma factor [Phycisphaeraceae bacterium]|nr:sigma-70 family RNA polymerase sigma factor [Phycisphaeraceae bacterium]MCP4013889.1 sigma-70 family RNA polymerase sigma factor [Phycisphaeraceae bacterium]MCP4068117.1 sigma-70 family RNA polymerase sigma factor [Phycisphaeraceae bacterium]MCP4495209.1 sigma-70 family RNA polymerase sigma factor [Phycisphaeraceae bacterium]MCP4796011.1 sigma-70 family RNA polymerase sigma factor [Phycisphaeraceae bacterium]
MDEITPDQLAVIVRSAGDGDEAAWRTLVEAFSPRVFALVRAQCRDEELAEEITQSTFCTIATKLADYDEVGRFESWLMRIAMNRLRDEMRRRKRHARPASESTLVGLAGEVDPPDRADDHGLPEGDLRTAIERLPDADREILYLRHVGGLSFKQLAEALETPMGTLLARHHRALKKVREMLEGMQAEAPDAD